MKVLSWIYRQPSCRLLNRYTSPRKLDGKKLHATLECRAKTCQKNAHVKHARRVWERCLNGQLGNRHFSKLSLEDLGKNEESVFVNIRHTISAISYSAKLERSPPKMSRLTAKTVCYWSSPIITYYMHMLLLCMMVLICAWWYWYLATKKDLSC